ncbi:YeeE/YedE thiosulfate transporter family protein [Bremerella sp. T1]|uniref:YeeE/YedE thiosulfate transporter family protein n=1 Tax=Bremerella sp. TYQ1 TaxID=3119568 RepID=UPI001CCA43B6|nr:YeeE/YedE thiosulfate transporter family protein [Bremerella volcania]UBM36398.1 YeeE/YedE family protein [Bremerella volcania]
MDNTSGFISDQSSQPSTATSPTGSSTHTDTTGWSWLEASPGKLAAGLVFGMVFGFLLQKGGVAKFDILIGVLLLENFVVVKVMMTAIIVGMIGSYFLRRANIIDFHINETKLGANILGGLIFGVGFGLLAYCPGTNAAAVGQGNLDAMSGIVGLLLGSYVYAMSTKFDKSAISNWGHCGKLTLNSVMGISQGAFIAFAVPGLVLILVLLEVLGF